MTDEEVDNGKPTQKAAAHAMLACLHTVHSDLLRLGDAPMPNRLVKELARGVAIHIALAEAAGIRDTDHESRNLPTLSDLQE
jgi:hypothetical protein